LLPLCDGIALLRVNDYILRHIGNAYETAVYFSSPCNYNVSNGGTKSVVMKTMGNYKLEVTVMFAVLADGSILPTYDSKPQNFAKKQLPSRIRQK
jgi:hypothetical protein